MVYLIIALVIFSLIIIGWLFDEASEINDSGVDIYAKLINEELRKAKKTLSTAESCTGGGIAARLTSIPKSSEYFRGGLIPYQNEIKTQILGVNQTTIEEHDVVSEEVVEEMVKGCLKMFGTDYAICTTGYADKSANEDIPNGTIWIGYGTKDNIYTYCITSDNGRTKNIEHAISKALMDFTKTFIKKQEE
jgi:PncC family amidohydrolase